MLRSSKYTRGYGSERWHLSHFVSVYTERIDCKGKFYPQVSCCLFQFEIFKEIKSYALRQAASDMVVLPMKIEIIHRLILMNRLPSQLASNVGGLLIH